ncbi:MAG: filamentous hemagglutinin N-terminal domain-containing protein [Nitrospirota bacterium]
MAREAIDGTVRIHCSHALIHTLALLLVGVGVGHAQVSPPPITSSGLNTVVTTSANVHTITGGIRPGSGTNLFHSFGDFNVPTNTIASFLNKGSFDLNGNLLADGLATSNILARVTNPHPSSIFGTIQTTGFGNANLFLMNPAGVLFGPNATVNVGGIVTFTTADYLRLADNVRFNTIPNVTADTLLSQAPVAAFGFLGSNPGAITIQGSQFTVTEGTGISLVGGDITLQAGTLNDGTVQPAWLSAPGGQINLASVASAGEVSAVDFMPTSGMTMGNISLSQGALLDVSSGAAGAVRIRGGQLVMDEAIISADTVNSNGAPLAIDINVTGDVSISTVDVPALTARTTGSGNAGEIRISSQNLDVSATALDNFIVSAIDTHTSGSGKAGDVRITATKNLKATSDNSGLIFFIDSGTIGPDGGHGGNVTLNAKNVDIQQAQINTGDYVAVNSFEDAAGSGGNLTINADSLSLTLSALATDGAIGGSAGDLTISARDVQMSELSFLSTSGFLKGGKLQINADHLLVDSSQMEAFVGPEGGGGIIFKGKVGQFTNGSSVTSSTASSGNAGNITFTSTERLTFADSIDPDLAPIRPSGLFTTAILDTGSAAEINVNTPLLELTGGARFDATTRTSGNGGRINIVADQVTVSGERPLPIFEGPLFGLVTSLASGIYSRTVQSRFCTGPCGNAGPISITTGSLSLNQGARIDSNTTSAGNGGDITISASQFSIAGTTTDGSPSGVFTTASAAGSGGNIALAAGQSVSISDGASVSAGSTGPGNAGNIAINAGQQFEMRNGSVKTEAAQASGGNIDIQAIDRIRLVNSSISTSVLGGAGSGGNITIDPNVVILQNSQVIAQAFQGAGGNISIVTPLFLADAGSLVDASSQFGLSGTVNIQSPTSNLAGTVSSLPSSLRQMQSLQTGRCAALADSRSSSLIVAGRDILPAEPGGWSPSPFALMGEETDSIAIASPPVAAMTASADAPVSLRRLTPAGFLTQRFAESGLTGCRV